MSQTETLLVLVLGFALASLIALFIGRFFWGVAIRLGARRMRNQVPSTVKDLQADRDRLRADYAMISQKLGSHLEQVKTRMAEQMAEVSRGRNRILALSEDVHARDAEIASLKENIVRLEAELAARTAEVDSLSAPPVLNAGLEQRIRHLTELSQDIANSRAAPGETLEPALAGNLDEKLAAAERETAALQQELAKLDAQWSEKLKVNESEPAGNANVVSIANRSRSLQKDIAG